MNLKTSLINYSDYSERYGFAKIESIVQYAVKNNLESIALTDVGTLYGAIDFIELCNKNNIKPILGVTFNLRSNIDKDNIDGLTTGTITLIAKNKEGYKNLNRLLAKQEKDNSLRIPLLRSKHLKEFNSDLICITGNELSMLGKKILSKDTSVDKAIDFFTSIYGENLILEKNIHNDSKSQILNNYISNVSNKSQIKTAYTNQNKVISQSDIPFYKQKISASFAKENRQYEPDFDILLNKNNVFTPISSIEKKYSTDYQSIDTINNISRDIAHYEVNNEIEFPSVYWSTENEFLERIQSAFNEFMHSDYLINLANDKLKNKYMKRYKSENQMILNMNISDKEKELKINTNREILKNERDRIKYKLIVDYQKRLSKELRVIKDCNGHDFTRYFATFLGFVDIAKELDSSFSVRGSALSSMVVYLGLEGFKTESMSVDPLENGLLFERFLNSERSKYPDIDIDLGNVNDVLKLFSERFHNNRENNGIAYLVTPHSSFASLDSIIEGTKNSILNSNELQEKLFKANLLTSNNIHHEIESKVFVLLNILNKSYKNLKKEKKSIEEVFNSNKEIKELIKKDPFYVFFIKQARKLQNNCDRVHKGSSTRVIISNNDLTSGAVPVSQVSSDVSKSNTNVNLEIQVPDKYVEKKSGYIKYDLLASVSIDKTEKALKDIKKKFGVECDTSMHSMMKSNDIIEMFSKNLLVEIFQFSTKYAKGVASKIKLSNIDEVINLSGLLRPGPNIYIDKYTERVLNNYNQAIHPELDSTYGIILFEEQVINIGKKVGLLTDGEAERLRLSLKEDDKEALKDLKRKFINNAQNKAVQNNEDPISASKYAEEIFKYVSDMSGYTFNKGHAIKYAMTAFQQMWIKKNYPAEYIDYMDVEEYTGKKWGKQNQFQEYFEKELPIMGVQLEPLDINKVNLNFKTILNGNNKSLQFGLRSLLNLPKNNNLANVILDARPENGFINKKDFICLVIDKIALENNSVSLLKDFKEIIPLLAGKTNSKRPYLDSLYETNALKSLIPKEYPVDQLIEEVNLYGAKITDKKQIKHNPIFNQVNNSNNKKFTKQVGYNENSHYPGDHASIWKSEKATFKDVKFFDSISTINIALALDKIGLIKAQQQGANRLKVYNVKNNKINSPVQYMNIHKFTFYGVNINKPTLSGTLNFIRNLSEIGILDSKIKTSEEAYNLLLKVYNDPKSNLKKLTKDLEYAKKTHTELGIDIGNIDTKSYPNILPSLFSDNNYNNNDQEYKKVREYLMVRRGFDKSTLDKLYSENKMGISIIRPQKQGELKAIDFYSNKTLVFLLQDKHNNNGWGQTVILDTEEKDGIYQEKVKTTKHKEYVRSQKEKGRKVRSQNSKFNIMGAQEDCVFRLHSDKYYNPVKEIIFCESIYDSISKYELDLALNIKDVAHYGLLGKGAIFKWLENELSIYTKNIENKNPLDESSYDIHYLEIKENFVPPKSEHLSSFLKSIEVSHKEVSTFDDKTKSQTIIPKAGDQKIIYFQVDKLKTFKKEMEAFEAAFDGKLKVEYIDGNIFKPKGKQATPILINHTNFKKFLRAANFNVAPNSKGVLSAFYVEKEKIQHPINNDIIKIVHSKLSRYFGKNPIKIGLEFDKDDAGINSLAKFDFVMNQLKIENTSSIPNINAPDDLNDVLIEYKKILNEKGAEKASHYIKRYNDARFKTSGISSNPTLQKALLDTYSSILKIDNSLIKNNQPKIPDFMASQKSK